MKNIFICHRPYHVLRSGDIIFKNNKNGYDNNILISFNLININTQHYQDSQSFPLLEKHFTNIIRMSRNDDVSIWNYQRFKKYYKKKTEEYSSLVNELCDFDHLYFFSDLEKPIEILVGMLKEKKKSSAIVTIVDEGYAAYCISRPYWKSVIKYFVVMIGRYKYMNHTANYGRSHLYTSALATFPEKCVFRNVPITKMLPLSLEYLNEIVVGNSLQVDVRGKFVLYLSSILDLSFGISQDKEIEVLKQLKEKAENHGYKFYIKPHPVQDKNHYALDTSFLTDIVETQLPAEVFFTDSAVIASVASSSLINAKTQGIRTVDLSNIFRVKKRLPSFGVYSPSNFDEYEQFIKG